MNMQLISPLFMRLENEKIHHFFQKDFIQADKIILCTIIAFSVVAAFLTSFQNGYFMLGMIGGGVISFCAGLAYLLVRGELICRLIMATALIALMGIYIQQTNGYGEGHFIFFISMTILIRYLDMIPLLWASVVTIAHHFTLTYCQANDIAVFGQPVIIFSWGDESGIGIIEPLIYHLLIATAAILISAYYIYHNIKKFLQDTTIAVTTEIASSGDLSVRADNVVQSAMIDITNQFVTEMENVTNTCGELSDELLSQSDLLLSSANARLQSAEQQQEMIAFVAAATTDMSSKTDEVFLNIENASKISESMSSNSIEGKKITSECEKSLVTLTSEIGSASEQVAELDESGQQISSIVETISSIAEQTNLLALNAAIEAARAGEQGRGFAVVADEVRVLSRRTHESTEEISSMISNFKNTTGNAVKIMEQCMNYVKLSVEDFNRVNTNFSDIASSIKNLSELTNKIIIAIEDQSSASNQINEKIIKIHTASEEFTAQFTSTLEQADNLKQHSVKICELISKYRA